jgi:low temperature requirement protein LtrA
MIKRLFHAPTFHKPSSLSEKKPTWLELFYDLIYVAAFIQLGNLLSKDVSWAQFIKVAGIFIPLWISWTGYSFYSNQYNIDDFLHRILVFLHMFCVGAMAISIRPLVYGEPTLFGVSYAISLLLIGVFYTRSFLQEKNGADYASHWAIIFTVSGLTWLVSLAFDSHFYLGWILGSGFVLATPFFSKSRLLTEKYPSDPHHISERYGLLTIIVLGESFVKVLSELSNGMVGISTILQASFALLLTCSIWWIYFDDVADSKINDGKYSFMIWVMSHIPLQISIVLMGVGIKKAVTFPLSQVMPEKYALLLCFSVALALFSTALIDSVTSREEIQINEQSRVKVRLFSGILILFLGITSQSFTVFWILTGTLFICLFQICFDLISAPFATQSDHHKEKTLPMYEQSKQMPKAKLKYLTLTPVLKGLPNDLKKDIYYYFIEASWSQTFVTLFFVYVLSNMFFAFLFLMVPGTIQNGLEKSFSDAFFFSVQTMSTIGFGSLSPQGIYSNVIVTVEAAFGLIGIALVTGMIFSKISRPSAKILFSNMLIASPFNGKKTLMCRIGNTRGNDIIDATISMAVLLNEKTLEGESLRRIHYLQLISDKTPFFRLSWFIRHVIDKNSPLYKLDLKSDDIKGIIITLTGHDSTYSDTIHASHMYSSDDIEENVYFEDIMSHLPDGRLMVDYTKFHHVKKK